MRLFSFFLTSRCSTSLFPTMPPKKAANIGAYFKRKADDDGAAPAKEARAGPAEADKKEEKEEEAGASGAAAAAPLSPEQQGRLEASKAAALQKRALATGVPPHGLMHKSWATALQAEFDKEYYKNLMKFLESEHTSKQTIFPPADQVYSWAASCPLDKVRVVIVGQDPYHGPKQAHGLCFSVQKGVATPPSLVNIYKELETDIPGFKRPPHGCLTSWAEQGVLLLNAVLTVRQAQPNSHKDQGWEKFTDAVIDAVNKKCSGVVFINWGLYAQKKGAKVDKKKHFVLNGAHPSPLSATKFFGCKHFSQTNTYLVSKGFAPINWGSVMEDKS
eukprot:m.236075 g.236075  ORF g.236075 m.236075 type:complete len:331 (+) comp20418_c0_seq1:109-1101(+)